MAEFAKYAFNKSHAACYAVVAYRTAYLKAYYPAEFMAATLNSFLGNLDKIPQYIDECKLLGIEILKPDINKSNSKFTVENIDGGQKIGKIRFGLGSIKNVGLVPIDSIIKERNENGKFKSFTDFCERIADEAVNKKCIESLIRAGAFQEFPENRATLLASFETIIDTIQSSKKKGLDGQVSMFDIGNEEDEEKNDKIKYTYYNQQEFTEKELLSMEKEMLGIYVSGHPLEKLRDQIEHETNINTKQIKEIDEEMSKEEQTEKLQFKDGQNVKYAGIITAVKKKYTKTNKIMAFVTVEDLFGQAEIIVFENAYLSSQKSLIEENIVLVDGRLSIRENEETKIIAKQITDFGVKKHKVLIFDITELEEETKAKLRGAIKYFSGEKNNISVKIRIDNEFKPCGAIFVTDEILKVFEEILGKERVNIEEVPI